MQIDNTIVNNNKFRFPELDCLRGVAVLVVMFYHYTFAYDFHYNLFSNNKFYLHHGNLAVHMFFIISGFVIFLTLNKTKNSFDFIVSRFSRLYPAYWAAICVTIIFLLIWPVPDLGNFTLKEIALNVTMLQGFTKVRLIDQVYWTLKMELLFYGIMLFFFHIKQLKNINIISAAWLCISFLSLYISFPLKKYVDVLLILEYAPLFIAGINFFKLKTGTGIWANHLMILLSFVLASLWMIKHPDENYTSIIILGIIYFIFYIFIYKGLNLIVNKFLLFFGSISYSLYLIHNVIGYSIIYRVRKVTDVQIIYIIIPSIITIAIAYFVTKFIEKPAIQLIRANYNKVSGT